MSDYAQDEYRKKFIVPAGPTWPNCRDASKRALSRGQERWRSAPHNLEMVIHNECTEHFCQVYDITHLAVVSALREVANVIETPTVYTNPWGTAADRLRERSLKIEKEYE